MTSSIDVKSANNQVDSVLSSVTDLLPKDATDEIKHYLDHDEPEIAFEGMFLELMQLGGCPASVDRQVCINVGKYLNLDKESVLDDSFWPKFIKFLNP